MYRYFLHLLSDWPLEGACNSELFGPDIEGTYLATFDADDHRCPAPGSSHTELTADDARAWVNNLPSTDTGLPL